MDMSHDPRTPLRKPDSPIKAVARPEGCDGIGLVLQGGGALGAYQAGVYQALHEAGIEPDWISGVSIGGALGAYQAGVYQALHEAGLEPDWVVGVSIGAINSAIIAGNPPERRLERLEEFWNTITSSDPLLAWPEGDNPRKMRNALSAMNAMLFGQPGFFKPNPVNGWLAQRGSRAATALYDTSPLHRTLEKLVDFELINSGRIRFAVGAVNVETANFAYFDNAAIEIAPEHIMASGALPPALPMVRIGKNYYWDGGLVSNTPLQHLLDNCGSQKSSPARKTSNIPPAPA